MPGMWFEEFEEGMVIDHELRRELIETDNRWFTLLTMNTQPVHLDRHAAKETEFGKPLMNSLFTLGCLVGMTVTDTTLNTTVANLAMEKIRFPHPLFEGDSLRVRTTILGKRASRSRPGQGIVNFRHEGFNQDGVLCVTCERAGLMKMRPASA